LNPGDPFQLAEIRRSRANFFRTVPTGTGYWVIDSDPGSWEGSPAEEFVDILEMNRQLIDAHTTRGESTKLIYWMLWGWGTATREENRDRIMDGLAKRIHAPWLIAPYTRQTLDQVAKKGLLQQTVYFPYGVVEAEPFAPISYVKLHHSRETFKYLSDYPHLRGVMSNSQSPLVQLPNLVFFSELAWNPELSSLSDREVLKKVAALVYPGHADTLANGWLCLSQDDIEGSLKSAETLENLSKSSTSADGVIGRFIFPDAKWFFPYLIRLLRMHAHSLQSRQLLDSGEKAPDESLKAYLTEALETQKLHGFNIPPHTGGAKWLPERPWVVWGPDYDRVREAWKRFAQAQPPQAARIRDELQKILDKSDYEKPVLQRMMAFVLPKD
jgi:hypothetical protein